MSVQLPWACRLFTSHAPNAQHGMYVEARIVVYAFLQCVESSAEAFFNLLDIRFDFSESKNSCVNVSTSSQEGVCCMSV